MATGKASGLKKTRWNNSKGSPLHWDLA